MGYTNFREVYHKLAIVLDNGYCLDTLNMAQKNTTPSQEVNSALVYGYIDKLYGVSYKVLGLTYYEDGDYTLVWPGDEIGLTVRGECFQPFEFIPIENKALKRRFSDVIETVKLYSSEDDEITRSFVFLDPFRHPNHPDDVMVIIENDQLQKCEKIWAKLKKYIGKTSTGTNGFTAILLDEPFEDIYDMHIKDEILVAHITRSNNSSLLIGVSSSQHT